MYFISQKPAEVQDASISSFLKNISHYLSPVFIHRKLSGICNKLAPKQTKIKRMQSLEWRNNIALAQFPFPCLFPSPLSEMRFLFSLLPKGHNDHRSKTTLKHLRTSIVEFLIYSKLQQPVLLKSMNKRYYSWTHLSYLHILKHMN